MRARLMVCSATAAVLALVPSAAGGVQPASPAFGAKTSAHPTFSWEGDPSIALYIASQATVLETGAFAPDVLEQRVPLQPLQKRWTPTQALFAGRHWWNVLSHSPDTLDYSTPWPFDVRAETHVDSLRTGSVGHDRLGIAVRWRTNEREVVVQATVLRKGRRVGSSPYLEKMTHVALEPATGQLSWRRPRRVRSGTRLTLVVAVRGPGARRTVRRSVLAP